MRHADWAKEGNELAGSTFDQTLAAMVSEGYVGAPRSRPLVKPTLAGAKASIKEPSAMACANQHGSALRCTGLDIPSARGGSLGPLDHPRVAHKAERR